MVLSVPNSGLHHIKNRSTACGFFHGAPAQKLHDTVAKWL